MPIYEYRRTGTGHCPFCQDGFELLEPMTADPATRCPECGTSVERTLSTTAIHGQGSTNQVLSNKNLAEKGFTKYQKAGDGTYERVAGNKGPKVIQR